MKTHKGTIIDILFITFFLAFAMIAIVITYAILASVNTGMIDAGLNTSMLQSAMGAVNNFNELMIFIYVGCGAAAVISAFAIRTHPIFFVLFLLVQIFFIALTPMVQDTYNSVMATPSMNTTAASFPVFQNIIDYLPVATLVLSTLVALVMFALPG